MPLEICDTYNQFLPYNKFTHVQPLLHDMKALNLFQINLFHTIYFIFKWKEKIAPPIFHSLLKPKAEIRTIFDQEENQQNHFIEKNVHSLTLTIVVHIYGINHSWYFRKLDSLQLFRKKSSNSYWCFMIQNNTSNLSNFKSTHDLPMSLFLLVKNITFSEGIRRERGEFTG